MLKTFTRSLKYTLRPSIVLKPYYTLLSNKPASSSNSQGFANNKSPFHHGDFPATPIINTLKKVECSPLTQYSEYIATGLKQMNTFNAKTACRTFQKAYNLSFDLFGDRSTNSAVCLNYLAQAYQLEGNAPQALKTSNQALDVLSKDPQGNYVLASDIHHNISLACQTLGELNEALQHDLLSLDLLTRDPNVENDRLNLVLQSLGKTYLLLGNLKETRKMLFRALNLYEEEVLENNVELGFLFDKLSCLMEREGKLGEALNYKLKAVNEIRNCGTRCCEQTLFMLYLSLGSLYEKNGNEMGALKALESAYEFADKDCVHRGPILMKIGNIYFKEKDYKKSADALQKALAIFKVQPPHNGNLIEKLQKKLRIAILKRNEAAKSSHKEEQVMMEATPVGSLEDAEKWWEMGVVHMENYHVDEARAMLIRAMQIFSMLKDPECIECEQIRELLMKMTF